MRANDGYMPRLDTSPPKNVSDNNKRKGEMMNDKEKRVETKGTAAHADKGRQLSERRKNRGGGSIADWGSVNGGKLASAVSAVCQHGMAIMLGYTRDGSAYTIRYIGEDAPAAEYIRPTEDIDLHLDGIAMDFEK